MSKSLVLTHWHPASWHGLPATQQPKYADPVALERAVAALSRLPPLVVSWEVEALRDKLARAQRGEQFVLQGGDCAESFADCESDNIARRLKILLQMSLVLLQGLRKPVIRIGRFAGQYAKPRSADTETKDGITLPCYRGDNVNRPGFTTQEREPDPELLLRGYERASLTLNFVRALIDGGFADLHHPEYWDLSFLRHAPLRDAYQRIVDSIAESLDFFESMSGQRVHAVTRGDFYTSHEGLHLLSEQAQSRYIERQRKWYIEYFRGISNPIGVKVGAAMSAEWLQELVQVLNPQNQPGRLTFIHRFGIKDIEQRLPPMIEAVRATGSQVLWVCDPMHGNTETTAGGVKTRRFDNILGEVEAAFRIHEQSGSMLGGVHIELTGEDVTECIGGARGLAEADLARAYKSPVDPRLNAEQALELAMLIARHAGANRRSK
jgi:3-deoxy-7-phosphoheptulonate synthase